MPELEPVRSIPSKRLNQQIRQAAFQYDWDHYAIGDLYDPEKEEPALASYEPDDQLLRIVLLCRARSVEWQKVLKKAITYADLKLHHHRRPRYIVSEAPGAIQTQDELYGEMASRLIDPLTMEPVDISEMSNRKIAREVADGNIQLEYTDFSVSVAPEWP